jgi:hypothetical protein
MRLVCSGIPCARVEDLLVVLLVTDAAVFLGYFGVCECRADEDIVLPIAIRDPGN